MTNSTQNLPDVADFIAQIGAARDFFDAKREIFVARAPGRLDLMGGIADYSGALVLQYPIREATFAAIQIDPEPRIRVVSRNREREVAFEIGLVEMDKILSSYEHARAFFRESAENGWAAYVVGVFLVLRRERAVKFTSGARIFIASDVPEGKGVSSSAALEVATMQAVNAALDLKLEQREIALLCQKTENEVVGAPCGVMDQMVSACGEENKLLALVCQPAQLRGTIELPESLEIWGVDSGIRHSVAGADYSSVRAGAFIGYRMIAEIAGFEIEKLENNLVRIADDRWRGYLANLTPAEFEKDFRPNLPEKITGAEFLKRFYGTTDQISVIASEKEYAVLAPTAHPIYENARVRQFAEILSETLNEPALKDLGALMYASHASYTACGLGSEGTDRLVDLVKRSGTESGLFGAKITGGGSGGTVAVLGRRGAGSTLERITENYARMTGHRPQIFSGSSPGAAQFGFLAIKAETRS